MRGRVAVVLPLALVVLVLAALPIAALTDTAPERFVRDRLGSGEEGCVPRTADSPGWREDAALPARRDEPRAVTLDGRLYLAGGVTRIVSYDEPSRVPGVERVEVESLRDFGRFDPGDGEYESLAPLPEPLNHIGLVTHGGYIYAVGGHGNLLNGLSAKHGLFRYSPARDRWTELAPMPTPRGAAGAAVLGDQLYVVGGMRLGRALTSVERFDFSTGRWSSLPPLPDPREHAPAVASDGSIYVVGGRSEDEDATRTVFRYSPAAREWSEVAPLRRGSGGLEALPVNGRVLAVGGGNDRAGTVTGAVQVYDPASDRWELGSDMRTPRHGFGAAVLGDRLYALGGSPCALFAASDIVESYDTSRVGR